MDSTHDTAQPLVDLVEFRTPPSADTRFERNKSLVARPMPFPGIVPGVEATVSINWTERHEGGGWHGEGQDVRMSWAELRAWASDVVDLCDRHDPQGVK
jgi:hypothetical protein